MSRLSPCLAVFVAALAPISGCASATADFSPTKPAHSNAPLLPAPPPPSPSVSFVEPTSPAASITPPITPPITPAAPLTLEQRLDKRAVTDEHYARKELYSWTTPDQITKLRETKTLLVATAKTRGAPSPYSRLLTNLANGSGPGREIARLLSEHPGLTKRRYAWPSPFATAVPLGERSYGHALIHIVLKDEAYLAKLDPLDKEPFSFVDANDKSVASSDVLAHPERLAAVFHVRRKPDGGPRFREYIVCNEAMVASWSVGTPHDRDIVTEDATLIAALLQSPLVTALGKDAQLDAATAWARKSNTPILLDAWRAALAFDSPKYKPSPKNLETIAESLAAYDAAGEPLEHKPSLAFPDKP